MNSNLKNKVCFIVHRMNVKTERRSADMLKIIPVMVIESVKGKWVCALTGDDAGKKRHFHKDSYILFDSLLGARGHIKSIVRHQINHFEKKIDEWYDQAMMNGVDIESIQKLLSKGG